VSDRCDGPKVCWDPGIPSNRTAPLLGAAALAAGSVLAARSEILMGVGTFSPSNLGSSAGLAAVLLAVVLVACSVVPAGARTTPAILVLVGVVLWLGSTGRLTAPGAWQLLGGILLASSGISVLFLGRVDSKGLSPDPVRTIRVLVLPRRLRFVGDEPRVHERLHCYGALVTADFSEATRGRAAFLEVSVTAISGRVDLVLPPHWFVVPGRLLLSVGSHMEGTFDDNNPVTYLGPTERLDLQDRAQQAAANRQSGAKQDASSIDFVGGAGSALKRRSADAAHRSDAQPGNERGTPPERSATPLYPVVLHVNAVYSRVAISRRD
jgi:hypothetical protein